MCDPFLFFGSCERQVRCENDPQKPLLIVTDTDYGTAAGDEELHNPTVAMALTLKSWLNGHRLRYLILLMCSPLLIPIVCAVFPFLCAAEVCFLLCRRRRRRLKSSLPPPPQPPHPPRNQEDGGGGGQERTELTLLDRYLDDQLELALEILNECRSELGYGFDYIDDFDTNRSNSLC